MTDAAPPPIRRTIPGGGPTAGRRLAPGEASTHDDPFARRPGHPDPACTAPPSPRPPFRRPAAGRQPLTLHCCRGPLPVPGLPRASASRSPTSPRLLPAILLLHDRRACRCCFERLPTAAAGALSEAENPPRFSAPTNWLRFTRAGVFRPPAFPLRSPGAQGQGGARRHWFWGTGHRKLAPLPRHSCSPRWRSTFALAIPMFSMTVYDRVVPNNAVETLGTRPSAMPRARFRFPAHPAGLHRRHRRQSGSTSSSRRASWNASWALRHGRPLVSVGNTFAANLRGFEGVRDFIASATVTTLIDLPFVLLFLLVMAWSRRGCCCRCWSACWVAVRHLVAQDKMHELTETTYRAPAPSATPPGRKPGGTRKQSRPSAPRGLVQRHWERATFSSRRSAGAETAVIGTVNFCPVHAAVLSILP